MTYTIRKSSIYASSILLCILLIGYIDYITGYEISLSLFYIVPILVAAWTLGMTAGVISCVLCITIVVVLDFISGEVHEIQTAIFVWNALAEFGLYAMIGISISLLKKSLQRERTLSITDPLTGISNTRHFRQIAEYEIRRGRRYHHPITLVFIDCDNFKKVNDSMGHAAGDLLLKTIAHVLRDNIRENDTAGRIGGDEFAILLPETGSEFSRTQVKQIVDRLEVHMAHYGWPVSFSIGIATFMRQPVGIEEMLQKADHLMYQVKRKGKKGILQRIFR
jgi:diguanylate cyclase (GGDEF)-like protein